MARRAVALAIVAGLAYVGRSGLASYSRVGVAGGVGVLLVALIAIFLFRGLGGYVVTDDGVEKTISIQASPTTTCG